MKKRNLLKIFVSVIALFAFFGIMGNVNAAYPYPGARSAKITDAGGPYWYNQYGYGFDYNTSKYIFTVYLGDNFEESTQIASSAPGVCMSPTLQGAEIGNKYRASVLVSGQDYQLMPIVNDELLYYLYYGFCPDGCTIDVAAKVYAANHNGDVISPERRTILVHSAASYVNDPGNWRYKLNDTAIEDTRDFVEYIRPWLANENDGHYPTGFFAYKVANGVSQTVAFIYTTKYDLHVKKTTENNVSGVSLAGAKYRIYSDRGCSQRAQIKEGQYYDDLVTDAQGNTQNVPVVTKKVYYVKELSRPLEAGTNRENKKFDLDTSCYECDLYNSNQCNINSKDYYTEDAKLFIKKVDGNGQALIGASFELYKGACGTGELIETITPSNSEAKREAQSAIELDTDYCIRESVTPEGYKTAADHTFRINTADESHIYTYTAVNIKKKKGSVKIKKVDEEGAALAGAVFSIYDGSVNAQGNSCEGSLIANITSGDDGYATKDNLEPGTYCITERSAPRGYKKADFAEEFTIQDSEDTQEIDLHEVENTLIRGGIIIEKSALLEDRTINLNGNSNYTFNGTTFLVYQGSCGVGTLQGTYTIDDDKDYVIVEDLEPGTYCVKEKDASKGFIVNTQEKTVKVTSGSSKTVSFSNAPRLGTLKLIKYSNNESLLNSDVKKYSLQGAEFKVTNAAGDDMGSLVVGPYVEGVGFETNTLHDIPFGTYYAKEVRAPDNGLYEMDKNVYTITISQSDTDPSKENGVFRATNKFKKGEAYVNKVPAEEPDGSCTLAGAEYAVCKDEDCREVVVTLITKEDGKTQTEKLEPGVYYFQEQKAPDCFEVNSEVQRITVASGTTVEVTSKEQLIPKNPKTGIDNPYLITITTVAIGSAGLYFLRRKNAFRQI